MDCVKLLLAFGADPLATNRREQTPQDIANEPVRTVLRRSSSATLEEVDYPLSVDTKPGLRILFLDGGGIRGLAQIEMLMEIERRTKKKIVDMFDWIVGTSTGGIVALGLIYGKKTMLCTRAYVHLHCTIHRSKGFTMLESWT